MPASDSSSDVPTFIPLSDYEHPDLPTNQSLRQAFEDLRARVLKTGDPDPLIAEGRLDRTSRERLDRLAAPPACGEVLDEMSATFGRWLADPGGRRLQVVVMPPCDEQGIVAAWAERHGLPQLAAPARETLLGPQDLPDLDGDGVLVIPRLEDWVLRHRSGMGAIRALMQALAATDRRCLVGCNAHGWAFLDRALSIGLQLPVPLTFRPFDARRLHAWLSGLARAVPGEVETFRLSTTGEDVMATDEDGKPDSDFMRRLAARSLGIPWVAWSLWRGALRDTPEVAEGDDPLPERDDDRTLWIAEIEHQPLPRGAEREAMAVLHSLLIHGALTPDLLRLTLPLVGGTNVLPALIEAGLVSREGDTVGCVADLYPSIRKALWNASYPLGAI